jgi:hypothetical protein
MISYRALSDDAGFFENARSVPRKSKIYINLIKRSFLCVNTACASQVGNGNTKYVSAF